MVLGLAATLKVALVVIASSLAIGVLVGFHDGAATGKRAFGYTLPLCAFFGTLQVVDARYLAWVLVMYAGGLVGFLVYRKRRTHRR